LSFFGRVGRFSCK